VRAAFPEFVASHARLVGQSLEPEERATLSGLLRTVLRQVESSESPGRT